MSDQFARLLAPMDLKPFWERHWSKEHLHLRREQGRYDSFLRIADLDSLFQSEQLSAAFLNVVTDGALHPVEEWSRIRESARGHQRVVNVERLLELYTKGATVILNQSHHAIPRVATVCREMALEMGFATQANVYITPAGARGFPLHSDDHEVFVLQILGRKNWVVSPPGGSSPIEIELQAGDLLYIPRGLAHQAACRDTPSVHVTLGFMPVYPYQLLEELAAKARTHPGFQQALPPGEEPDFVEQIKSLLAESPVSELRERRFRALVQSQIQGWPGRLSDLLAIQDLTLQTVVCARPGILHTVTNTGKSLDIEFAGQKITVPVFMKSCVDRFTHREPFAIKELQGMITDSGKIEIARKFILTGFLWIVQL